MHYAAASIADQHEVDMKSAHRNIRAATPAFHPHFMSSYYTVVRTHTYHVRRIVGLVARMMVSAFVSQYGLVIVGFLIVLESAGLPLPGETSLLLAAAGAAHGLLPIGAVIAVAAVAAIIGDNLGYWIGQRYGLALPHRRRRMRSWCRKQPQSRHHAGGWIMPGK